MIFDLGWRKIFGSANDRILKTLAPVIKQINAYEPELSILSDEALKSQTNKFKLSLNNGATLDDILAEAFATVREVAKRTLQQRHFDVQLMGGLVLHKGMIAQMRTGEGKTLSSTLPIYLNALTGKGVHVVTVNDYLASRDSEWMGEIYKFLGLSVGCIINDIEHDERAAAYNCDITYGTNNEFGFDYLRDNMKYAKEQLAQKPFNFAIIDEVDSILIDEARTPLVISGPTENNSQLYYTVDKLIHLLSPDDYEIDEKTKSVTLTEIGTVNIEKIMQKQGFIAENSGLYDIENISLVHHVNQALKAHKLFIKDIDYMIHEEKLMIIDEFTGRALDGRRYSEGLHQALEAKENLIVQNENQTLASITFQNYFRLYPKIAGMTGSASTEADEFREIYRLSVVDIPSNITPKRIDEEDVIYRTSKEKYQAIIEEIVEKHKLLQPILVGTISIEKSEYISSLLKKKNIKHKVLNAKYHEQEAQIIAQAGKLASVTIATNMAGRGTDIKLGGNNEMMISQALVGVSDAKQQQQIIEKVNKEVEENKNKVLAAGGLFVIGTERHESRRIDNQLRGRSGRQGDLGRTKFFLSLEDDLMRIFASERMSSLLKRLGLKENEAIFHPMITRALEKAQKRVEGMNYEIRKNLLKFDDVMSEQRKIVYEQRLHLIESDDISEIVAEIYTELNQNFISSYLSHKNYQDQDSLDALSREIFHTYGIVFQVTSQMSKDIIYESLQEKVQALFREKVASYGAEIMHLAEKRFLLTTLDQLWKEHLHALDHLRQGINLRAYGQRDPLNEYKKEAFEMFSNMLAQMQLLFISRIAHVEVSQAPHDMLEKNYQPLKKMQETRLDPAIDNGAKQENHPWGKVGRNELCPCGSGKKYKHCHGKLN
jgi:preprotein translocase subunit SecA